MKKFCTYFLSIVLLLSSLSIIPTHEVNAESNITNNPYIKALYDERTSSKALSTSSPLSLNESEPLVDPEVEENILIHTLEHYYQEDIKVADFLSDITTDEKVKDKVLSIDRSDKILVMYLIKDIYHTIQEDSNRELLYGYLNRYVLGPDENEEVIQEFINEIAEVDTNAGEFSVASTYNGTGAGNWAYNNYNKYSTNYPKFTGKFGTDCTNFVSQAMHVGGGKAKAGNWTISKKNSTYWVIDSAAQLNHSWSLTDPSPWISVQQFSNYWRPKSNVHRFSSEYYRANHKTIYNKNIYKGDVVVLYKGVAGLAVVPTHLMIVSAYDTTNKDFLLAGHSNERQAYPLLSARSGYSQIEILEIPH
ncbi:amidase domain-containing protein [Sutcliffiella halmapala]|uniref:amidase domain-containing protein n=1 Tax=Sutcliffiella halmapala TaxID=79882 RepID=UPI0009957587|nr:amidase domain-containing protein [Sutcliffiella halmapala]